MPNKNYLIDIIINEPVIRRVAIVEGERRQAIAELLEKNTFHPVKKELIGPFIFVMEIIENGQTLKARLLREDNVEVYCFNLSLKSLRRIIKDYFQICSSYYDAIKKLSSAKLETIDMSRRAIHNEAGEDLKKILKSNVEVDYDTARRLFTLITIMHIRG